jgi:hypothetical protein
LVADDPYDVLVDLLDGGEQAEVTLRSEGPFDRYIGVADADDAIANLSRALQRLVDDVSRSFGEPRFFGDASTPGYPGWSRAARVAVWALPDDDLSPWAAVVRDGPDGTVDLRVGVR